MKTIVRKCSNDMQKYFSWRILPLEWYVVVGRNL